MNIVLIVVDTLRYDYLGANGNGWIQTPNLDRLAAEGWCFDLAFSNSFPTIPHRTDLITGSYGRPFNPWKPLAFDAPALPWLLAGSGYATQLLHDTPHLVNGGHNFDWPFHAWTFVRGAEVDRPWLDDSSAWPANWAKDPLFDCLGDGAEAGDRTITLYARANRRRKRLEDWNCARLFTTAADFLRDNARRENFFLWVDCFDPHEPWDVPPEFLLKYDRNKGFDGRIDPRAFARRGDKRLSDAARARIAAMYAAKVSWVDHWLGRLLEALDATGLARNTAVVLTADHGTRVGEGGQFGKQWTLSQAETRVPLLIRTPEGDEGRSDVIIQPQDIFATVLGLAGVAAPCDCDGQDVLTLARAGQSGRRQLALAGHTEPWQKDGVLFSAFDDQWELQVTAKPENCRLTRVAGVSPAAKDAHAENVEANDETRRGQAKAASQPPHSTGPGPIPAPPDVAAQYPDVVARLHRAALDELARRGADPRRIAWARAGGDGPPPKVAGDPLPPGYYHYYERLYLGK